MLGEVGPPVDSADDDVAPRRESEALRFPFAVEDDAVLAFDFLTGGVGCLSRMTDERRPAIPP